MDLRNLHVDVIPIVIGGLMLAALLALWRLKFQSAAGKAWKRIYTVIKTRWFPRNRKLSEMDQEIAQQRQRLVELGQQLDQCLTQLKTQQLDLAMAESYRALTGRVSPLLTSFPVYNLREIQNAGDYLAPELEDDERMQYLVDAQSHLVRAMWHTRKSEHQQSLTALQELNLLLTNNPDVQFNLGYVLIQMYDYRGAMEAFGRAAVYRPDDYQAYWEHGLAAENINEGMRAFQAFCDCWRLRPNGDLGNLFSAANSLQTPESLRAAFEYLEGLLDKNGELQIRICEDPSQFEPLYYMIQRLKEVGEVETLRTQRRVREIPALVTLMEYNFRRDATPT